MALFTAALNSGSNGNCYYVGTAHEAVLVDAGISCRETERRMAALGLSMQQVKAVFISHEHSDHISGLPQLARKYRLPVYISQATLAQCPFRLPVEQVSYFQPHVPVEIGGLAVIPFPKEHDAIDPYSFVVRSGGTRVGVFTDIGKPCSNLAYHFSQCHAAYLESNYDEAMLQQGRYPHFLKQRIRGGRGHLSNQQAVEFFAAQRSPVLQHLILSHLSRENNCPELVATLFGAVAAPVQVHVASRYAATALIEVGERGDAGPPLPQAVHAAQISLFD